MSPGLRVCVEAINNEAEMWEEQSGKVVAVSNAAYRLRMSRFQVGIFQIVVSANNDVCDLVSDATLRANHEMDAVADALRTNSRAYEQQEAEITASVPMGF